jgi:hypothetical protein
LHLHKVNGLEDGQLRGTPGTRPEHQNQHNFRQCQHPTNDMLAPEDVFGPKIRVELWLINDYGIKMKISGVGFSLGRKTGFPAK